jgi:hypothetical protein
MGADRGGFDNRLCILGDQTLTSSIAQKMRNGMAKWWQVAAAKLQDGVTVHEQRQRDEGLNYDDETVRISIVHARQDIVLIVSHLASLNRQIAVIKYCALVAAAALAIGLAIALRSPHG